MITILKLMCLFISFMIGGDGQIYEGAGWHKVGAHARGWNSKSLGVGFIGDFQSRFKAFACS